MNRKLKIALLSVLGLFTAVFAWAWFAPCGLGGCAPVTELERFHAEGSELFDAQDRPMGRLAMEQRRLAPLDSVPRHLPQAFIAIEDRRFYNHDGVDWRRVLGAMWANLRSGGVAEGGSTITMQLARNLFPRHLPYRERSIRRKLMEIRVARQIEGTFDKDKILELYLNHIYLGEGAYGVEAAAQEYFGRPASQLTLAQAATIGGLGQLPSRRNPRADSAAARRRRDEVLRAMVQARFITPEQGAKAAAEPMGLARARRRRGQEGAWFVEQVRAEMEERVGESFYRGGLKVYTTYDRAAQAALEAEVGRQADRIEEGAFGRYTHPTYPEARGETDQGATPYLQTGAVVMDARSGAVLALVGGRDFEDSSFDRVYRAQRQPGSAFKPFVYLVALRQGIPPTERIDDAPVEIRLAGGDVWRPRNYTGTYDGLLTLRDALTRSKNAVTVRLSQRLGIDAVADQARALGITTDIPRVPATALGAAEVRPIELVTAYAAFANGGIRVVPHLVRRVEDGAGTVLWEAEAPGERVVDEAAAFVLTTMLRDVVDRGTGTPVRGAGFRGPAAGKTGTTNGATDIWFVGYTPDLVASVWFGMDRPQTVVRGASGGTIAAPVWGRLMSRIYADRRQPLAWSAPSGVIEEQVSRLTGYAVDPQCPSQGPVYTEYFVNSRPPRPMCLAYDSLYGYPPLDTVWRDEEWGADVYGSDTFSMPPMPPMPPDTGRTIFYPEETLPSPPQPRTEGGLRRQGSREMEEERRRGEPAPRPADTPRVLGRPVNPPPPSDSAP